MSPRIPPLTHLQYIVLGALLANTHRGRALRRELAQHGVRRTAPAFYQMMGRLEDAGWVDGRYQQEIVDGQIIKEREYRITLSGQKAWTATRDFYVETSERFARKARVAHA